MNPPPRQLSDLRLGLLIGLLMSLAGCVLLYVGVFIVNLVWSLAGAASPVAASPGLLRTLLFAGVFFLLAERLVALCESLAGRKS